MVLLCHLVVRLLDLLWGVRLLAVQNLVVILGRVEFWRLEEPVVGDAVKLIKEPRAYKHYNFMKTNNQPSQS